MERTRLSKIERLLQKELSDIFHLQTQAMRGVLVSVSVVRVSTELSVARAYLSIFPSVRAKEVLEFKVRKIPELTFFIDDSLDYIENIDNLLKK